MNNIDVETLWHYFALLTAFVALVLFTLWTTSEKHLNYYYLGSGEGDDLELKVDIENAPDQSINLNGATYNEAVDLVNELNNNIKKNNYGSE